MHQWFISAHLHKSYTVTKIPDLIRSFQGAIQTDLSPQQLGQLACIGTKIPSGNILFASFPTEHFRQARQFDPVFGKNVAVLEVDFTILRSYITLFSQGAWPMPESTASTDPEQEESTFCR